MATAAALTMAVVAGVAAPAAASPPVSALPVKDPTETVTEQASAMHLAWKTRQPVEIVSERTESSETFAQPDGTLRVRQHAAPVRVQRDAGFVPVDPSLVLEDGVVRPEATTLDVRFSAGGDDRMLTVVRDGRSLSMSWPGVLPKPVITGDTATYPEVLPGVDLQLAAQVDSFSEVLVVKNAAAAADPALQRLQFGIETDGVTLRSDADGFLTAVTPEGERVFASDGARMWDKPQAVTSLASIASKRARVAAAAPESGTLPQDPEPRHVEDVPVILENGSLTVVPSQQMLADPATVYPVSIDPGFNGGKEIWTHVSRKNPTKSYWSDSATRDDMRVGQMWHGTSDDDWRTIVQFNVSKLSGTQIVSAAVHVNVRHSADCSPSPLQLWRTNYVSDSSAVTWNSTKDKSWTLLGSVKATANKSACPKGNDEVKYAQTAVKTAFADAAKNGYATITLAFRAADESDEYQWKKLVAGSTYLDINYNHKPAIPDNLTLGPCYAACGNGTAVTSSKQPQLSMRASDPDGGTLRYEFEVYASNKTTQVASSKTTVTGVASGKQQPWTVVTKLADGQYYWRGRACDATICSGDTGWFGFKVDATNPGNPAVTSTDYPPTGWNGGPGTPGKFTFSPGAAGDAVKYYTYSLNGGRETQTAPPANGVLTVTLTPDKDLVNTLRVKAIDTAGNLSGGADYPFKVRPIGDSWYWSLDEGTGTTADSAPENSRPASMAGTGVTWSETGKGSASALTFAGTGELTTSSPVFNTLSPSGFTVAAWVRLPAPPVEQDADGGIGTADTDDEQQPESPLPVGNRIAVSQDGTKTSMFSLGYRTDLDITGDNVKDPAWCFTVAASDTADAATTDACTTNYVEAGTWVHLVGVVNPMTNKIQLYVNGTPAVDGVLVEKSGAATWEAAGKFAIGRGWSGTPDSRWTGEIDEVHVTPRIWSEQEIDVTAGS
ncbi:LamG-like jellyroll fold domain-containing protein [Actinoplanes ianthinogenes]|uniref:LamG-like jellyroll fold domain-containing protein n=1 Tax=Actinoplanes ianthinogenes TaxID=122358 RepID=UPI001670D398|nr:LamG-like jellyroll fold domain-containing protein [Actinoplanes ianthinogenes]